MFGLVTALTLALIVTPDPTALPQSPVPVSDADILAGLRQQLAGSDTGGVLVTLASGFPEDYATFEQQLLERARAGTLDPAGTETLGSAFASAMVARHMDRVVQAGTDDLIALSTVRMALMNTLQQGHAAACHEFVEAGLTPGRIAELGLAASQGLEQLSTQVVDIIARPPRGVVHPEPAAAAWEQIGRRYAELGGDPAWITALFGDRDYSGQTHAARCASAVLWETAVSEADPEVRAYYISALYIVAPAGSPPAAP
jgi:hypothetical protein